MGPRRALQLIAIGSCLAATRTPQAQTCLPEEPLRGELFYEQTQTQTYICSSRGGRLASFSWYGRPYVSQIQGCVFEVFDAAGPAAPALHSGLFTDVFGPSAAYAHNDFRTAHVAWLDDFPFGFQSQSTEGWVLFRIEREAAGGPIAGFTPSARFYFGDGAGPTSTDMMVLGAALFRAGGRGYVVARYLDQASIALRIADLGDGEEEPPLTIVATLDCPTVSSRLAVIDAPGGPYLYVFAEAGAHVYRLTEPAAPAYLGVRDAPGLPAPGCDSGCVGGTGVAVARVETPAGPAWRLYSTHEDRRLYALDVTDPASPTVVAEASIPDERASQGLPVASDGKLVAVVGNKVEGQPMVWLFAASGDRLRPIPHGMIWSEAAEPLFRYEQASGVAIVPPTAALPDRYQLFGSFWMRGYWTTVDAACVEDSADGSDEGGSGDDGGTDGDGGSDGDGGPGDGGEARGGCGCGAAPALDGPAALLGAAIALLCARRRRRGT